MLPSEKNLVNFICNIFKRIKLLKKIIGYCKLPWTFIVKIFESSSLNIWYEI